MPKITIDGFDVFKNIDGTLSIIVNSNRIKECMRFYEKHNLDSVVISNYFNYELDDVDFLADYPDIKHLEIISGIKDIRAIHNLHNLEYLFLKGKNREIDFSELPLLRYVNIEWSARLSNMDKCKRLERLIFIGYNPKTNDFLGLPDITWINSLELIRSTICTLNGLEKFHKLRKLEFSYCSKLADLCCLESSSEELTYLFFDHCKSIKNHDYATKLSNLYTLAYIDCGVIPSIKFIKKMASLKDMRFVGTDVTDGDMTPCIGLEYVAFDNKRHFSHTMEEIRSMSN